MHNFSMWLIVVDNRAPTPLSDRNMLTDRNLTDWRFVTFVQPRRKSVKAPLRMFTYSMDEHYQGSVISDLYESRHGAVFCSVVKHLGSGREVGKNTRRTSFVLYHFLRALQQNRAQSRLLYLLSINPGLEPTQKTPAVGI